MTVIQMSDRELTRLRVMIDLADGRLTVEAAATLMNMGRRQAMPDEPKPAAGRSYQMGNVGDGARVIQGEGNTWIEGVAKLPGGDSLTQQFNALLERIAKDASLGEDTRACPGQDHGDC